MRQRSESLSLYIYLRLIRHYTGQIAGDFAYGDLRGGNVGIVACEGDHEGLFGIHYANVVGKVVILAGLVRNGDLVAEVAGYLVVYLLFKINILQKANSAKLA